MNHLRVYFDESFSKYALFFCVYERDIVSYSLFTHITFYESKQINGRM